MKTLHGYPRGWLFALVLALFLAGAAPASRAGCAPLSGGMDSFPATATLVIDDSGFGQPFVVRLSSAGQPDATVQRGPQIGTTISTELLQLTLAGFHPRVGAITLRESTDHPSLGQIRNVALDGACVLASGQAVFDVFYELELPGLGQTWVPESPVHVEAALAGLPPEDASYEVPWIEPVVLRDEVTSAVRGTLFHAQVHADPPLPPPGPVCFDVFLNATLTLPGPQTANLVGFGPSTVLRGAIDPGGTCTAGGQPCDADADCGTLNPCKRPSLATEVVALNAAGFDVLLGNWHIEVRPVLGNSNCCVEHAGGGCTDPACESLICGLDSFCCNVAWDSLCADLADSEPVCAEGCLDPLAAPTLGAVKSVNLDRTYPATSYFDYFIRLESTLEGTLHNTSTMRLQPSAALTNFPPPPQTTYVYSGLPKPLFNESGGNAGQISNVVETFPPPRDCTPPPGAAEDCLQSALVVELSLPPCPTETVTLAGPVRVLRDDPGPGIGFDQDFIAGVLAHGPLSGVASCAGPLTAWLASSAVSGCSSLTPEEFFPADAFFDATLEIASPTGALTAGPLHLTTSVDALPPRAGETYFATNLPLDLVGQAGPAGQILSAAHVVVGPAGCPSGSGASMRFTGPAKGDFDVSIPHGGAGVDYDVVRGDLAALRAGGGDFSAAACLFTDADAALSDGDTPAAGAAFYYVARDGLGAYNGTWNGAGSQVGDRDAGIPGCP